jgi:hypothetical protein
MAGEDKIPIDLSEKSIKLIIDGFYERIAKQFADFMNNIETGQKGIATSLSQIEKSNRLEIEKLNLRADANRDAVKALRDEYEINKKHLEYLATVKPTLETIQKVFKFWTWKGNWKKIIGVIAGTLIVIFFLFWVFLSIMKFKGFVSSNESTKITGIKKIEYDIKNGHISPNVRAIQMPTTQVEIDSAQAEILKYNIKPVTITYNKK